MPLVTIKKGRETLSNDCSKTWCVCAYYAQETMGREGTEPPEGFWKWSLE